MITTLRNAMERRAQKVRLRRGYETLLRSHDSVLRDIGVNRAQITFLHNTASGD